jgi:hypothetical protein
MLNTPSSNDLPEVTSSQIVHDQSSAVLSGELNSLWFLYLFFGFVIMVYL